MQTLGNIKLLEQSKTGYFSASKIATLSVLPTLDWAAETAQNEAISVMSGFHSRLEKQVLHFLLKGKCGIICVLARGIYKQVPARYAEAFRQNRVLFVSLEKDTITMPCKQAADRRNAYIAKTADRLVFSSLSPESSLYKFSQSDTHQPNGSSCQQKILIL